MMKKCVLVVFSNPLAGKEEEYNEWYNQQHLADVLKVPGFVSAQRFKLAEANGDAVWRYLAIYEFEADDPAGALGELTKRAGTPHMVLSEAMDLSNYSVSAWAALTGRMTSRAEERL